MAGRLQRPNTRAHRPRGSSRSSSTVASYSVPLTPRRARTEGAGRAGRAPRRCPSTEREAGRKRSQNCPFVVPASSQEPTPRGQRTWLADGVSSHGTPRGLAMFLADQSLPWMYAAACLKLALAGQNG